MRVCNDKQYNNIEFDVRLPSTLIKRSCESCRGEIYSAGVCTYATFYDAHNIYFKNSYRLLLL